MSSFWNDERLHRLKLLWAEGRSSAEIADDIGTTRNAVMGRISRMRKNGHAFARRETAPRAYSRTDSRKTGASFAMRPWHDTEIHSLVERYISGDTLASITEALGRSRPTVSRKIEALIASGELDRRDSDRVIEPVSARRTGAGWSRPGFTPTAEKPKNKPIPFVDRNRFQCSYIEDETSGVHTMCCGAAVKDGASFCDYHYSICFRPHRPGNNDFLWSHRVMS